MIIYDDDYWRDYCGPDQTVDTPNNINGFNLREYPASAIHVFQKDPSSVGPSVFLSRPVDNFGTHSLFVGLNFPMNLKIDNGQTPNGTLTPFMRMNYVYRLFLGFCDTTFPVIRRMNL